jgi:2-phospho-L-lactate/phosphoenolpyruvate guanylyltransferase
VATSRPPGWTIILPLKGGPGAKSRLGTGPDIAEAIALDCLDAVLSAGQVRSVLVVTADPALGQECTRAGATVLSQSRANAGLLGAIDDGIAAVPGGPCAVLLGDLPALQPDDLDQALQSARAALEAGLAPMAAIPDSHGSGTVLLAAAQPGDLVPRFGAHSAARHQEAGALLLDLHLPRLRHDVDTPADLAAAIWFGVGPRTRAALARAVA